MVIHGDVSSADDANYASDPDSLTADFGGGELDFVEDLYYFYYLTPGTGAFRLHLDPANSSSDLNLYVLYSNSADIIAADDSTAADATVDIIDIGTNESAIIAVSLRSGPATSYTLTVSAL